MSTAAKEKTAPSVQDSREEDAALMQRIASGDEMAYKLLLERHVGKALRYMQRMLKTRQDAEDEVQKAFLKAWQEAPRWKAEAKFSTWFYRVLTNQAIDALRARKYTTDIDDVAVIDETPNAEEHLAATDRSSVVQKALDSLPDRQRQAIILCHYQELSQKDAAAIIGVSEGALESLLSRGRAALKQFITKESYH